MPIILPSRDDARIMRARSPGRFLLAVVIQGAKQSRRGAGGVLAIYALVQLVVAAISTKAAADMAGAAWLWVLVALGFVLLAGIGRAVWRAFWQARYEAFHAFKSADRGATAVKHTLTELRVIEGQARGARSDGRYAETFDLPTSEWEAHGAALPPMAVEEWLPVVGAYALTTRLSERVREREGREVELSDDLDGLLTMLEKGCKTLERLAEEV